MQHDLSQRHRQTTPDEGYNENFSYYAVRSDADQIDTGRPLYEEWYMLCIVLRLGAGRSCTIRSVVTFLRLARRHFRIYKCSEWRFRCDVAHFLPV